MKCLVLLLWAVGLSLAQEHEGNFVIRFEPRAVLQANAVIPFEIRVVDDRSQPVLGAKVTLQIETLQHTHVKVFNAPSVDQGVYIANATFPSSGLWSIYVEVHRDGQMSARTIEFNVPESAPP
ncbi:MAG: FixH family protein [Acidobacteriaceae bacterium]|nr:FixH family protein [Acidobacteriaceae bacterium]